MSKIKWKQFFAERPTPIWLVARPWLFTLIVLFIVIGSIVHIFVKLSAFSFGVLTAIICFINLLGVYSWMLKYKEERKS